MTFPRKQPEADDPYAFVAAGYAIGDQDEADAVMGRCLIEEYALMGFAPERVLRLFQIPTYTATHDIYQRRGERFVLDLIAQVYRWAPAVVPLADAGLERENG
jgi:hypothetical protein